MFQIKYGNLIKEKSTFIVNASNTELILGSGVSKAFRQHCGGSLFQQKLYDIKEQVGTINQGDVILSDSGIADNFKYALHVAVMNYSDDTKSPHPTYKQIQKSLFNILKIIEDKIIKEQIKSPKLVIPLLGCGTGGLKKEKVFFLIKNTFLKSKTDLEVILYLHEKKDYLKFKIKALKNITNQRSQ
jgi:O-acetyl-ADP-ribose deacetylase (regulator of RNase III)